VLAVDRFGPGVRSMLRSGCRRDGKAMEGLLDVAGHGDVARFECVIPLDGEPKEFVAIPIGCDFVQCFEDIDEVLGIVAANILDAKIIDDEGKGDVASCMAEQAGSVFGLDVSVSGEVLDEAVVCNPTALRKLIHSFANLDVNVAFSFLVEDNFGVEIVLLLDCVGDLVVLDAHVFKAAHRRVESYL
jgi:hypothetical protein